MVYGGSGKFELSGYYPRLDPSSGWSTLDPWDWFIKPLPPISGTLQGAPYGGPWDFKATSRGLVKLSFQWPADVKTHVVSDDLQQGLQPVQFCEDLYRDPNWGAMPVSRYGSACWHGQYYAGPPEWWGLYNQFLATDFSLPYSYHYVPYLTMAAKDPTLGQLSKPKTGITTVGYKADFLIPQNLTIDRSPVTVKAGGTVVVTGRFALDGAWKDGAEVTLLKHSGKKWVKLATGTTAADGKWAIKIMPTASMVVKAMATGDAATGVATEYSLAKQIKVR